MLDVCSYAAYPADELLIRSRKWLGLVVVFLVRKLFSDYVGSGTFLRPTTTATEHFRHKVRTSQKHQHITISWKRFEGGGSLYLFAYHIILCSNIWVSYFQQDAPLPKTQIPNAKPTNLQGHHPVTGPIPDDRLDLEEEELVPLRDDLEDPNDVRLEPL